MKSDDFRPAIPAPDEGARARAQARWAQIAKPLGSLGALEGHLCRIAALTGEETISLTPRTLLVFCADNGVVAQGVTQTGSEVTARVARALAAGISTASRMAAVAGCRVLPVDVGIRDFAGEGGVLPRRVKNGTGDITRGPAMTRDEAERAIRTGAELAGQMAAEGCRLLLIGEMGIGNTTTTAAVTAALLGAPPRAVTGRGAGLSSAGLRRKVAAVERALAVNQPDGGDPVDVLSKVGGLDLAALTGAILGAAARRLPVLLDGVITAAAALCAVRLCPAAGAALLPSHQSAEPAGRMLLDALGLEPLIQAGMRVGEGAGALAALPLYDMALAVYGGTTFADLAMPAYEELT